EGEQGAGVVAFGDGLLAGVEAGAAQQSALSVGGGWEFELVRPEPVLGVPGAVGAAELGAVGAVWLVGFRVAAAAAFEDASFCHGGWCAPIRVGNGLSSDIDARLASAI